MTRLIDNNYHYNTFVITNMSDLVDILTCWIPGLPKISNRIKDNFKNTQI